MKADDHKRCTYVNLSSLATASRPNQIRVYQLGCGVPCRLGFYDPFFGLLRFWDSANGQLNSVGKNKQGRPRGYHP